jgi:hypothetical protein
MEINLTSFYILFILCGETRQQNNGISLTQGEKLWPARQKTTGAVVNVCYNSIFNLYKYILKLRSVLAGLADY